ncbi:helix-turn-helix domain-containing protein [Anaerobacillus isosaccharinicus]|uniref:Helix-turn-helix transcriptional regulator n=1 Tax=Anaerobacillus isosaccharinicus TaxID=1532552 RepID=A0A1S2MDQ1_9BACI|nr:helix-turn-helix transcriptional regulator [Anaerobacillus isosaccharinicus]MBA5585167.1 helix-turn-helix transcriptional regulator [Anaerobacillus isosaccharinicus]QOY36496.1 helix-turn-helix transcriptional regulator [Anaerobacillus isosaccharinicus]
MKNFGQKLRTIREQKNIGLNQLALRLNVSSGYLSNLERGKTETIPLSLLEKLEKELEFSQTEFFKNNDKDNKATFNETHYRIERCSEQLKVLENNRPELTHYLLSLVEQGIELAHKESSHKEIH